MKALWLCVIGTLSSVTFALDAIDDRALARISGQSGLTIETQSMDSQGQLFTADALTFRENDLNGQGQDSLSINNISLALQRFDQRGRLTGPGRIISTLDVLDDGSLSVINRLEGDLSIRLGAIAFSGQRLFDGVAIERLHLGLGSIQSVQVSAVGGRTEVSMLNQFTQGSGFRFKQYDDGIAMVSDVSFTPDATGTFRQTMTLSADDDGLAIRLGDIKGGMIFNNLRFEKDNGQTLFNGASLGSIGLRDLLVRQGDITLYGSNDATAEGLVGTLDLDATLAQLFYQSNQLRLSANKLNVSTGGALNWRMDLVDSLSRAGVEFYLSPSHASQRLALSVERMTLTDESESSDRAPSFGGLSISNLNLNQGTLKLGVYAQSQVGQIGMRLALSITQTIDFDLNVKDDANSLKARVQLRKLALEQTLDHTEQGLRIGINKAQFEGELSRIQLGGNTVNQGQLGRLVVSNVSVKPNSYVLIEPIR